ncbi:MAG: hypothetical protein KKD47_04120 [Proteobacteria bacterium]|nr:hypothetical protein [Pseudomonadota bacterium]
MSNRSVLFLILFVLAAFLAFRFDVPSQVKMGMANLIYGDEMRGMKAFHVAVETTTPELEKEGLTREELLKELSTMLEKGGIRILGDTEWQKTPGKPELNVAVNAAKTGNNLFQYSVTIEARKSENPKPGAYSEKIKTLWLTTGVGEGGVSDIRARVKEEARLFLKSHSGS